MPWVAIEPATPGAAAPTRTPRTRLRSFWRRSVFRVMSIGMIGVGVATGLAFPAFLEVTGIVPPGLAWSTSSRIACLVAGTLVGGLNCVLGRVLVGRPLRRLVDQVREVDEVVRAATVSGDWSALRTVGTHLQVDSDDELGEAAQAFNALVGGLRQNAVERRRLEDALNRQASHDPLTGLPNRMLLTDRCATALRVDHHVGTTTGLLLIDLDRFKDVNDTFGHRYGDQLLTQVGRRLTNLVRKIDTVARLGGDEFVVLLPGIGGVDAVQAVAAKLQASLEVAFRVEGVDLDVEASIGLVVSGVHGDDAATLLRHADVAMYAAKCSSLGIAVYDPTSDLHSPERLALLGELRRALDRAELVLYYQPKLSIGTGDVVGAEALVRWQHPDRGLVYPDEFIPLAEHTGLIGALTRHVLATALMQARVWADAGRPITVSVNLSVRNLLDEHLPEQVADLLALHGVPPELLELEVTETAIMTDPVRAQRVLERLTLLGVRVSIDDFGAGYTSLGHLKNLPVSELKIDRSFVMEMTEDAGRALIVQAVVNLGHNLGLTLVAEGVETEAALDALAGLGCDVAQGYLMSRPVSAEAFDLWCAGRRIAPVRTAETESRGLVRQRTLAIGR